MHPARGGGVNGGAGGSTPKGDGGDTLESSGYDRDAATNHHRKYFSGVALPIALIFVVVGITCLILNQSSYPMEFFRSSSSFLGFKDTKISSPPSCENVNASPSSFHQYTSQNFPLSAKEENIELEKALRKATMKDNRTVILTTLNAAWTEPNSIFDLFLESFRIGNGTAELLNHVVVGALDQTAYERCVAAGLHCYAMMTEGVDFSGEAHFMSEDYIKVVWRKINFQRTVLELGYDFVFTDADIMWLRDPFERFYSDGDFQIACDHYWAKYTDLSNSPNSGFIYVKSNNRTVQFYRFWYDGREYFPGKHDQDVLNFIKSTPFVARIRVEIRFLDTAEFGGFCEPHEDMGRAVTMHANCCIGIKTKIHDLKVVIDDWKRYISSPADDRNMTSRSWTVPRICH